MRRSIVLSIMICLTLTVIAQRVSIVTPKNATNRERYAAEYLQKKLTAMGYSGGRITLKCSHQGPAEGYTISRDKTAVSTDFQGYTIEGNDPSGVIYGAVELVEQLSAANGSPIDNFTEAPQMVMRGTCIGLQKTVYLPGHGVYEYPYTPENFPWFYDKEEWIKYLDMMVENKYNSLYLWNGHPFASLVKLKEYPFALEVDE